MTIQQLIATVKEKRPTADTRTIERAYEFAKKAHEGQKRRSGEDFISHPLTVSHTLANLGLDEAAIAAALLHDTIEDSKIEPRELKKNFGYEITYLVEAVSKLSKLKYPSNYSKATDLHRLFFVMAKDIRAALIKLADRLHNMETLQYLPPQRRKEIAQETLDIYAPIADRLGMGEMKGKLEDLAFPYIMPKECARVHELVNESAEKRVEYLEKVNIAIKDMLVKEHIKAIDIHTRPKHYYSLYKKLSRYNWEIGKIYDLMAARIIVSSIRDCYEALGVVHKYWRPLPAYIKDFIAVPKLNGYKSLHTTVFCIDGKIIEIQIRTIEMHQEAEFGIAAHWAYSEQQYLKKYRKHGVTAPSQQELKWVKQLRDWQREEKSEKEFMKALKTDFFGDRILVFTPKGDIINLPKGATPIDFAYAIHTEVGHRCMGAKVNDSIAPLSQSLKSEDIVEIMTSSDPNKGPSRDWLKYAKTNFAKSKINAWFNLHYTPYSEVLKTQLETVTTKLMTFVKSSRYYKKETPVPAVAPQTTIHKFKVDGQKYLLTSVAKCCNPVYPDKINGYVTALRIIKIHKVDCKMLAEKDKKRIIPVEWE